MFRVVFLYHPAFPAVPNRLQGNCCDTVMQIKERTENIRVVGVTPLVTPDELSREMPASPESLEHTARNRDTISSILAGRDDRMLAIVGPCSIHDPEGAMDYAGRLRELADRVSDRLFVVMRVYFEKPRTTIGWKGLINDPDLDDSCDLVKGLHLARDLMRSISGLGLPVATEFLDPIVPQYLADLVSWAAIGARTTESQTHREMASGLSMPVGFKNGTDGRIQTAVDAMIAASRPHSFLGIDRSGKTSVIKTAGNPDCHLVLRGGIQGPNYDREQVRLAGEALRNAGVQPAMLVDCSHANSNKDPGRQVEVWKDIVQQRSEGTNGLIGGMIESYLEEGNQPLRGTRDDLVYGRSITDACLSWSDTEDLLQSVARKG